MGARRHEVLAVGPGGWITYHWRLAGQPAELLDRALVRFEEHDRRLEPMEMNLPPDSEPLTAARLRAVPLGRIVAWANAPEVASIIRGRLHRHVALPKLDDFELVEGRMYSHRPLRIPEPPYGDDFYRRVAADYSALARDVSRPAAELAEINGLPVTTVHTWVREARRRRFLPPGRKGKAG